VGSSEKKQRTRTQQTAAENAHLSALASPDAGDHFMAELLKSSSSAVKQAVQEAAQKTAQVYASSLASLNCMVGRV